MHKLTKATAIIISILMLGGIWMLTTAADSPEGPWSDADETGFDGPGSGDDSETDSPEGPWADPDLDDSSTPDDPTVPNPISPDDDIAQSDPENPGDDLVQSEPPGPDDAVEETGEQMPEVTIKTKLIWFSIGFGSASLIAAGVIVILWRKWCA